MLALLLSAETSYLRLAWKECHEEIYTGEVKEVSRTQVKANLAVLSRFTRGPEYLTCMELAVVSLSLVLAFLVQSLPIHLSFTLLILIYTLFLFQSSA